MKFKRFDQIILISAISIFIPVVMESVEVDRFAASVNDEIILESEIALEEALYQFVLTRENANSAKLSRSELINRLIDRKLLEMEARRFQSIRITDEAIDRRMNEIVEKFGSRERWDSFRTEHQLSQSEWRQIVYGFLLLETYVDQRIRAYIRIQPQDMEIYFLEHQKELGLTAKTGEGGKVFIPVEIQEQIYRLLREKEVNSRLEELGRKLRQKAIIRIMDTETPTPGA